MCDVTELSIVHTIIYTLDAQHTGTRKAVNLEK